MGKILLQTFTALLLGASGIYIMYIYLSSINQKSNFLILLGSLVCLGGSVYLLLRAGKSDALVVTRADDDIAAEKLAHQSGNGILERNNQLSKEWTETAEKKDKLHMLKVSASAQKAAAE